jgi:hypothetical protein
MARARCNGKSWQKPQNARKNQEPLNIGPLYLVVLVVAMLPGHAMRPCGVALRNTTVLNMVCVAWLISG